MVRLPARADYSRGSARVSYEDTTLTGEKGIFGKAWSGTNFAGVPWSSITGTDNYRDGSRWQGSKWQGSRWQGTTWSSNVWAGAGWE